MRRIAKRDGNRLISANNNGATFAYDPVGRRTGRNILSVNTNYLYDGANPVQELNGNTVTANLLTGLGIDEYFTRINSTGTSTFMTDALGSTIRLTDASGNSQTQYSYGPFGSISINGTTDSSYTYTGRESDGLGLYYRARYYNPSIGRFISEDPSGFIAGIDFYSYVNNNPTGYIDPFGLDLTPAQQQAVRQAAQDWAKSKVPYVFGGKSKKGADCSGSVHGVYDQAGISFPYTTSGGFKSSQYFYQVPAGQSPQLGDIAVFPGHVAVYDPNAGVGANVWSASHTGGPAFGPASSSWFGTPTYYRWK